MSWLRLDDKIATHRKTVQVGNEAFGAWVRMAAHCQGHGTDGRITRAEALVFGSEDIISRLLHVGFLDAVDGEPDVFEVHDLLHWNFTAEEAKARREKRAIAGKLGGKRSAEVRRHLTTRSKRQANAKQTASKVQANAEANAEVGAKQNATPSPNPINTNPLYSPSKQAEARDSVIRLRPSPEPRPGVAPPGETIQCPAGLPLTDEARAAAEMIGLRDIEIEWGRFVGHHVGHGTMAANFYGLWSKWIGAAKKYQATDAARARHTGASSTTGSTRNPSGRLAPYHKPFTDDD